MQFSNGRVSIRTQAAPAAGADLSRTVPNGEAWEILSIRFSLDTDANVANREILIFFLVDDEVVLATGPNFLQTAGLTVFYNVAAFGFAGALGTVTPEQTCPIPPGLSFRPNAEIIVSVNNVQAGDQISETFFYIVNPLMRPNMQPPAIG